MTRIEYRPSFSFEIQSEFALLFVRHFGWLVRTECNRICRAWGGFWKWSSRTMGRFDFIVFAFGKNVSVVPSVGVNNLKIIDDHR